jgi:hypothetical protein
MGADKVEPGDAPGPDASNDPVNGPQQDGSEMLVVVVGTGRHYSPRHKVLFTSGDKGSTYVCMGDVASDIRPALGSGGSLPGSHHSVMLTAETAYI